MSRPVRIGLIAEGEAELGPSIPYIKPEDGGKAIDKNSEGALHTLIRRELVEVGFEDCIFVQRHPSFKESAKSTRRTGHSVLDVKYLSQIILPWKPNEIDMIILIVDADDVRNEREQKLEKAMNAIRENHLDKNNYPIKDQSVGGLAIKNFETWLLADVETISKILDVKINEIDNLEDCKETKYFFDQAIRESSYRSARTTSNEYNQHPLHVRWELAEKLNLQTIRVKCPLGYGKFVENLKTSAFNAQKNIEELRPSSSNAR